ncbi:MAG: AAA family ATPase [Candidatus Thiodiazotropha sp.]|jgi:DNA repair protein SbcC/Rad50
MIIHAIKAQNVLKYSRLQLLDLPEKGLIAISGPNESGKSSIGETVCFALFGRTFSLGLDELTKVIRWGETHCSAELEFSDGSGNRYHLERFLDDAGNHSARLAPLGSEDETAVVRGVEAVADKIYALIGFEYEEFVESFYLAQREITTPHPHSYAVKTMAGLVTLEYCDSACQEDRDAALNEIEQRQSELANIQTQLDELNIDPMLMPEQERQRSQQLQAKQDIQELINELDNAATAYQDSLPRREKARSSRARSSFLLWVCLLLAVAAGAVWYLLAKMPEHDLSHQLGDRLASIPAWQPEMLPYLLYTAGALAVLGLIFGIRRASLGRGILGFNNVAEILASGINKLDEIPTQADDSAPVGETAPDDDEVAAASDPVADAAPPAVDRAARSRLAGRILDWQVSLAEVRDGVAREISELESQLELQRARLGQLDQVIAVEQGRLDKATQLSGIKDELKQKIVDRQNHLDVCRVADELIQGTTREISHQFNRKLRGLVGKTLPLFTEQRYEHLQIEDDLSVRAFSSEKRDFMDLEEISSGTQRQIMLAVRLALSQELVDRAVRGSQFLFLDEPFAFFDEMRTRNALAVLPTLSDELNQIWIVSQDFAEDLQFDRHIRCDREFQTLPASQD